MTHPTWFPQDVRKGDVVKTPDGLGVVVEGAPGILNPALAQPFFVRLYDEREARIFAPEECVLLCGRCMEAFHGKDPCPVAARPREGE